MTLKKPQMVTLSVRHKLYVELLAKGCYEHQKFIYMQKAREHIREK